MKIELKTEECEIDGLRMTCTQFPAMHSTALFARLLKLIGPALPVLMKLDPNTELEAAGLEIGSAFSSLNPDDVPGIICKILENTSVLVPDDSGGKSVALNRKENIDIVFSGRLLALFKAAAFAIRVNYRDFASGSAPAAPGLSS